MALLDRPSRARLHHLLAVALGVCTALEAGASPEALAAQAGAGAGRVQGVVLDQETGLPLAGATVSLATGPRGTPGVGTRVTNAEGLFLFREVPPGTYRLIVSLLGYGERRDTLPVDPQSDLSMRLPLAVSPIPLDPIVVEVSRRAPGPMEDFEHRRRTRAGTFITREQIEARNALAFTDLFRMVPGATVVRAPPYGNVIRLRGGCRPQVWLDGVPLTTDLGIDQMLPPMDVEAVEVYRGVELPVQFGANPCGAILVWTRHGERVPGKGSFWKRLLGAVGFLTLGYLFTR